MPNEIDKNPKSSSLPPLPQTDLKSDTFVVPSVDLNVLEEKKVDNIEKEAIKKKKGVKGFFFAFGIFSLIVLTLLVLVFSALGTTADNELSFFTNVIPVENIPGLNLLVKNPKLMVFDAFNSKPHLTGSINEKLNASVKFSFLESSKEINTDFNFGIESKNNLKEGSSMTTVNMGGKLSNSGTVMDFGNDALKFEYINLSVKEWFIKSSINDKLLNLFGINKGSKEFLKTDLSKIIDRYIRYSCETKKLTPDDPDFFKPVKNKACSNDSIKIDVANFNNEIEPKIKKLLEEVLPTLSASVEVTNMGREKINNVEVFKLNVDTSKSEFKKSQDLLLDKFSFLIFDNRENFSRVICSNALNTSISTTEQELRDCSKLLSSNITLEGVNNILKSLKIFNIEGLNIYVNTKTNELTRITFDLVATKEMLNTSFCPQSSSSCELEFNLPLIISIDYQMTPSEDSVTVTKPDKYIDSSEIVKELENTINMVK